MACLLIGREQTSCFQWIRPAVIVEVLLEVLRPVFWILFPALVHSAVDSHAVGPPLLVGLVLDGSIELSARAVDVTARFVDFGGGRRLQTLGQMRL